MKEERRVQRMGSAYTVYLPLDWIKKNNLEKGSLVYFSYSPEGSLVISSKKEKEKKSLTILAENQEDAITEVVSAYTVGANEIILRGKKAFAVSSEARNKLSGVEVVSEEEDCFKLRVFVASEDVSQRDLLKRIYGVTLSAFHQIEEALDKKTPCDVEELRKKEENVDRLFLLLLRISYQERTHFESISNSLVAKSVEMVCDHLEKIGTYKIFREKNEKAKNHFKEIKKFYEDAFNSFWKKEKPHRIFGKRTEFRKKNEELSKGTIEDESNFYMRCARIIEHSTNILEITSDILEYEKLKKGESNADSIE